VRGKDKFRESRSEKHLERGRGGSGRTLNRERRQGIQIFKRPKKWGRESVREQTASLAKRSGDFAKGAMETQISEGKEARAAILESVKLIDSGTEREVEVTIYECISRVGDQVKKERT